jgi:hypothetical protein
MNPDQEPALFVSGFPDANKNNFFPPSCLLITVLAVDKFTSVIKDNNLTSP